MSHGDKLQCETEMLQCETEMENEKRKDRRKAKK